MANVVQTPGVDAPPLLAKAFKVYVPGARYKHLCVGMSTEVRSSRLVFKPADPCNPEVIWAKRRILPDHSFELVNQASGQRVLNCDIFPRHLVVSAYYHPALLFAPARWMEAENAGGGGVADGGVRIVCVSAHVQKQNPLLPLKIAEWGANQQHGNNNGQMATLAGDEVVLEAEDEHDAASQEEEEEEEDDGGAEEVTASAPRGKRSLCCYSRIKHRIRRLFACL